MTPVIASRFRFPLSIRRTQIRFSHRIESVWPTCVGLFRFARYPNRRVPALLSKVTRRNIGARYKSQKSTGVLFPCHWPVDLRRAFCQPVRGEAALARSPAREWIALRQGRERFGPRTGPERTTPMQRRSARRDAACARLRRQSWGALCQFYSTHMPNRIACNALKTNNRCAVYSTQNRGDSAGRFSRITPFATTQGDTPCQARFTLSH